MTGIPGFTVTNEEGETVAVNPGQKPPGRRHYLPDGSRNLRQPGTHQTYLARFPKGLHRAFKRKAHQSRESMNTVLVELVKGWVLGRIDLELDVQRAISEAKRRH